MKLNRLINGDGEVVGYFRDHVAEMTARKEWDATMVREGRKCRSIVTDVVAAELEEVSVGDGERLIHYLDERPSEMQSEGGKAGELTLRGSKIVGQLASLWLNRGAADVVVSRYLVNKYRRPSGSLRDDDLGGPAQAAGVLYVLRVKAPQGASS